ncbi:MAG: hypothetical protein IID40_11690 [Planctomycetes bacterium]|nr:hypothetical protein [Planctomycetota bacterium]
MESPYRALECYDRAADILITLGDPDPDLTAQIRRRRHQARRQVLGVSFQLGLAYDSNVSYLGDAGASDLLAGRGDGKFSSGFQIDFAPVADRGELLAAGVRFGHSWHFAIEPFDYQDYGAYLRYARTLGDGWEISLRYDYDLNLLGNEPFVSQHSLTPALTHRPEPGPGSFRLLETTVYYRFEVRDYLYDIEPRFDRDGWAHSVGIGQRYSWRPIRDWPGWRWELSAGYRFESDATEGTEFDRRVHNFDLGLAMPLVNPLRPDRYLLLPDKELVFRFDVNWQIADYRNRSRFDRDRDERYDVITTYGFVLSQTLVSNPQDGDLVLHAIISWTDAHSNVTTREFLDPFTYDKVIYGLQLAWSW